jgi:RND family efflux transporter MFP subunit
LKLTLVPLALVSAVLAAACDRLAPQPTTVLAATSEADEPAPHQLTVHGERLSTYLEYPELVRGTSARVLVHLTVLATGEPVRSGKVTLRIGERAFELAAPKREGLYPIEVQLDAVGQFVAKLAVESEQAGEELALGEVVVHADDAAATAAARANEVEPADGSVDFLLEQQWQIRLQHEPARRVDMARRLVVPASVRLRDGASVELHAPLAGRLVAAQGRALPRAGERVKAGETLALVEPPLGADTLTAMHTLRLELEMQLLEANHEVEHSKLRRGFAQRELARLEELRPDGLSTLPEIDAARREVELTVHEEEVALGRKQAIERLMAERAPYDPTTGSPVIRVPVLATIDGVVVAAPHTAGASVETDTTILRVVDASRVWLEGRVSEFDLHRLQSEFGASATFLGLPGERRALPGAPWIAPRVSEESRTVAVRFELDNADGRLREGMLAELELATGRVSGALSIPQSALVMDQGVPTVYVTGVGESFVRRVVELGVRDGDRVQVLGGLAEGERVVTRGGYIVRLASMGSASMEHGHHH